MLNHSNFSDAHSGEEIGYVIEKKEMYKFRKQNDLDNALGYPSATGYKSSSYIPAGD